MEYELFGINLEAEEFDRLMIAQNNGKELKVINGKVVAVDHEPTEEEIRYSRISEIQARLTELSQDITQMQCGAVFDDEEQRIKEFQDLHNELRGLLGKKPRIYDNTNY